MNASQRKKLAPYVVVDDGRESGKPEIALIRSCDVAEIASVIRALSIHAGNSPDAPTQNCNVRLNGFQLTNSLGDGVSLEPSQSSNQIARDVVADMQKRIKMAYQESRNQRKRRHRKNRA